MSSTNGPGGLVAPYVSGGHLLAPSASVVITEDVSLGAINNLQPGLYVISFRTSSGSYAGALQLSVTPVLSSGSVSWIFDFGVGACFIGTTLTGVGLVCTSGTRSVSIGNATGAQTNVDWSIVRMM